MRRALLGCATDGVVDLAKLEALRVNDLWLTTGCAARDPRSLAAFDSIFGTEFERVFRRLKAQHVDLEDFAQTAREKLFVHEPPKIGDYHGQGDLRNWLRVMLTRTLFDMTRKKRETPLDVDFDEAAGSVKLEVPAGRDPEVDVMKAHYHDAFRRAFERATTELQVDDRNLLRQYYVHGLGIDGLAALLGVHRATAARRVGRARDQLLLLTRQCLATDLSLSPTELDSVMRLVESQAHVTIERIFAER
ncbi:MAG: sigma-70 family RNA polymerase sigma factor [Polyangiaceae bacterium]